MDQNPVNRFHIQGAASREAAPIVRPKSNIKQVLAALRCERYALGFREKLFSQQKNELDMFIFPKKGNTGLRRC
jgi:hypothetical protein